MRIGELAHLVGVSTRALRYYEQQGLLHADRTPSGQRIYPPAAVQRVSLIRLLLAAGLPSRVILQILPCLTTGALDDSQARLLAREHTKLSTQIEALTAARDRLAELMAAETVPGRTSSP